MNELMQLKKVTFDMPCNAPSLSLIQVALFDFSDYILPNREHQDTSGDIHTNKAVAESS